jgi:hypothetical protein
MLGHQQAERSSHCEQQSADSGNARPITPYLLSPPLVSERAGQMLSGDRLISTVRGGWPPRVTALKGSTPGGRS